MAERNIPPQKATIDRLRRQIADHRRGLAHRAGWSPRCWPTGLEALDDALPGGGLPCGAIVDLFSGASGVGAMSLAMRIAASAAPDNLGFFKPYAPLSEPQLIACAAPRESAPRESEPQLIACAASGTSAPHKPRAPRGLKPAARGERAARGGAESYVVLVDPKGDFYPPAAAALGLRLERLIVLRVRDKRQVFWAVDQSLRCRAVAVVIASMADPDARSSRRLQLAAESSGALGLLLRPGHQQAHNFAAVRLLIEGVSPKDLHPGTGSEVKPMALTSSRPNERPNKRMDGQVDGSRLARITLLSCREGTPAGPFLVDLRSTDSRHQLDRVPEPPGLCSGTTWIVSRLKGAATGQPRAERSGASRTAPPWVAHPHRNQP